MKILVLQGESERAEENELLGEFILTGPAPRAEGRGRDRGAPSRSTPTASSASRAKDLETGLKQAITVTATSGLTEDEIRDDGRGVEGLPRRPEARPRSSRSTSRTAEKLIDEIEGLFPHVEQAIAGSDFGQDAIKKARSVIERARAGHRSARDQQAVGDSTEALTRTLNMFKGVVAKTRVG